VVIRGRLSATLAAITLVVLVTASPSLAAPAAPARGADWPVAGQNSSNTGFQAAEHQISPANAGRLAPKWVFTTGGPVSATPTVVNGVVYAVDWGGNLFAINDSSGHLAWTRRISDYNGVPGSLSRTAVAVGGDTLLLGDLPNGLSWPSGEGAHLIAVDAATGNLRWITRVDNHPASRITGAAVVAGGVAYVGVSSLEEALAADPTYPCCSFRGSAVALDVASGRVLWKTVTVPEGFSGGAIWSSTPAVDPQRGSVYVTTGNNYSVPPDVLTCVRNGGQNCLPPDDHVDSVLSLDRSSGAVNWSSRATTYDAWTVACQVNPAAPNCPSPAGPDFDFGAGPNLFTVASSGRQLLGAGQKSGIYWAFDPGAGQVVWSTRVGPGGTSGGVQWGTSTDGRRVYVEIANSEHQPYRLISGQTTTGGAWSGLDAATGQILWQTADPLAAVDTGPTTVANGVVFAGSLDPLGHMYGLDAASGAILFAFASGGSVAGGASIANGTVYWGSGYLGIGTPNTKLYAFKVS
jgi:polyvinyl alcohol dehydrogenase (cytochrome)